jgi:hypothetical protein
MRRLEEPAERMLGNCQVTVREYVRLEKIAELIVNRGRLGNRLRNESRD